MLDRIRKAISDYETRMNVKIKKFRIYRQPHLITPTILIDVIAEDNSSRKIDSGIAFEDVQTMQDEYFDLLNKDYIEY